MTRVDWPTKHFQRSEFVCHCGCDQCEMQEPFMAQLEKARDIAGIPFEINSGYRCQEYDKKFGANGNHSTGWAADIAVDVTTRMKIVKALILAGFERIGVATTFVHCDAVPSKIAGLWIYDKG